MAVTDGSYMEDIDLDICSVAFIFECQQGSRKIVGSFAEHYEDACAYWGELMGLMAIHLILWAINLTYPDMMGSIQICSGCNGALGMVKNIPNSCIPNRCKLANILKNILIHGHELTLRRIFTHVKAHQDDGTPFHLLDRPLQLNCMMDKMAKQTIRGLHPDRLPKLWFSCWSHWQCQFGRLRSQQTPVYGSASGQINSLPRLSFRRRAFWTHKHLTKWIGSHSTQ